jgi:hypothetical protein
MPSEKQLLEVLEKDTVDTSRWTVDNPKEAKYLMEVAEGKIYSVAIPQADGTLRAWHVTDDPQKVIDLLKEKGDFYAREGDLCGGLYVSAVPHFWEGRSQRKWDFLPKMSREARGDLYQAIYDKLVDEINSGYITPNEFANAEGVMAQAMSSDYWQILDIVANQPFNINIAKLSKELGLATPFEPQSVPVDFVGRYLEFNTKRAIEANEALLLLRHGSMEGLTRLDLCNMLKEYGWDGVFTKASMGTNPELVIWSGDKVVRFGDWMASLHGLGSPRSRGRITFSNLYGEARFEGFLSADRTIGQILDSENEATFSAFNKEYLITLSEILSLYLRAWLETDTKQRLSELTGEKAPLSNKTILRKIEKLEPEAGAELMVLSKKMLSTMV